MEMACFHLAGTGNRRALLWVGLLVTNSMLVLPGRVGFLAWQGRSCISVNAAGLWHRFEAVDLAPDHSTKQSSLQLILVTIRSEVVAVNI